MTLRRITWIVILSPVIAGVLAGQVTQSGVVGTCTDPSGAAVPNAAVTARNTATNQRFEAQTNISGNYVLPSLPIGIYELTASATGFKSAVRDGIVLDVGERPRVDFRLEIGVAEQKVEITAEAPVVDTDTSGLGAVIENRRISELPLNSRQALSLAVLTPGVRNLQGGINVGFGVSSNYQVANIGVNGSPSGFNSFLLDGGMNTNTERGEVAVAPLVESIAEFKVLSNYLPPEYGLTGGGVINTVTKSGSNALHGSIYEFLRNDKLDARNTFAAVRSPFRYNQFGTAVGGPVWIPKVYHGKDRTFFFFNYEGSRYRATYNPITSVPIAPWLNGDFSNLRDATGRLITIYDPNTTVANPNGSGFVRSAFPGNIVPKDRFDKVALNVLPYFPNPNRTPVNAFTQAQNFLSSQPSAINKDQYHVRIDHTFGASNRLFGRWSYDQEYKNRPGDSTPWPDPLFYERLDHNRYQQLLLSDVQTFSPSLLNEFRGTVMRQSFPFTPASYGGDWPQKLGLPSIVPPDTFPQFAVGGYSTLGSINTVGLRYNTGYQVFDMVTKIHGNHTVKVGFEARLLRESNYQNGTPSGIYNFGGGLTNNPQSPTGTGSGLAQFELGAANSASISVLTSPTNVGHTYGWFVGDDWKVARRLSLNLGLRYDFQSVPIERRDHASNFNPFVRNPNNPNLMGAYQFAGVDYGSSPIQPDRNDFGPRIGFAYNVFGNSKTVLRGGYAILYVPTFSYGFFPSNAGFSVTSQYLPPGNNSNLPAFQLQNGPPFLDQPSGAKLGANAFLGSSVTWEESNKRTPYMQQWNFGIQQELPKRWMLEASYAGNRGLKLLSSDYQYDDLDPRYLGLGLQLQDQVPNPLAGQVPGALGNATVSRRQTLLPYPQYSGVSVYQPHGGASTYHSFLFRVERRFASGLTILASYTNAKLISDSERSLIDFLGIQTGTNVQSYQMGKFNRRVERAIDPTDVAQRMVVSYVYELPVGRGKMLALHNRALNALLGDWSTSGLFTAQGGMPVVIRGASNFLADRPNSTGTSAKLSNPTQYRWFDTTQFINPPNYTYGNVSRTMPDIRGPGLINMDVALLKTVHIRENLRLQFRAEAFNVANLTNLGMPSGSFSPGPDGHNVSSTFGTISSAFDPRTMQFGLKVQW